MENIILINNVPHTYFVCNVRTVRELLNYVHIFLNMMDG